MATIFLRSTTGNDANDGLGWATAKATLAAALTAAGAGGIVYVSKNHGSGAALSTAITLASPGTAGAPVWIICVDDTGDPTTPTTLATTGVVATTASGGITFTGFAYCYGVTFKTGSGASASNILFGATNASFGWVLEACGAWLLSTSANARVSIGSLSASNRDSFVEWLNTQVSFSAAGQAIHVSAGRFTWRNTVGAVLGTAPTKLFAIGGTGDWGCTAEITGVDLSAVTTALVGVDAQGFGVFRFSRCRLGTGVAATNGVFAGWGGVEVYLDQCSDSAVSYTMDWERYAGSVTVETTLVRTGGATDGTTTISWKMASSAGAGFVRPLSSPWIEALIETVGSPITFAVEILHDSLTNLKQDQIWLEVEYLGTAGYPLASYANDRAANVLINLAGTASDQPTSTATWTTTGMANPNTQKLQVTFTPQRKGAVRARVLLGAASTTVYVDPVLGGLTSSRQFLAPGSGAYINSTGGTATYTAASNVRNGVDRGDGVTGTLVVPVVGDVRFGTAFDTASTGTLALPAVGDVREAIMYGASNTEFTGTCVLPIEGDVGTGVQYGAGGTEFTGTLVTGGITQSQAQAACAAALTAQGYTTTRAPFLDKLDPAIVTGTLLNTDNSSGLGGGDSAATILGVFQAAASIGTVNVGQWLGVTPQATTATGAVVADMWFLRQEAVDNKDGTLQAATNGPPATATLDPSEPAGPNALVDRVLTVKDGTGVKQSRIITAYDGTTKAATVHRPWDVVPAAGDNYYLDPAADRGAYVFDSDMTGHVNPGTAGAMLASASSAGDPLATPVPGGYPAGTTGYLIGHNLDAKVSDPKTLADGSITSAKFAVGSVSGAPTGLLERLTQVWRRLVGGPSKRTKDPVTGAVTIQMFADDGATVQATQAGTDDGLGNQTIGAAH